MQSTTPLEVTYLRTTSLKPDPRNPMVHSDKQVRQIAQSIESFGFNVPLLIGDDHITSWDDCMLGGQLKILYELELNPVAVATSRSGTLSCFVMVQRSSTDLVN